VPGTGQAGIGPVKQPVRVVDVIELIGGKVAGRRGAVRESAAGTWTCGDR
jgi:hypothetical protein